MVDGLASAILVFLFFFFCRKVNCLQLCAAGCADNKHDHSLSSVCCLFQKAPLVLLLHSLSDNEGDWSILPLLPQWVSPKRPRKPDDLAVSKRSSFQVFPPSHRGYEGTRGFEAASKAWLIAARCAGGLSDVSVTETKGAINCPNPAGLNCSNKLLPESSTLLASQKSNVCPLKGL